LMRPMIDSPSLAVAEPSLSPRLFTMDQPAEMADSLLAAPP
jgi:hypothetical protein